MKKIKKSLTEKERRAAWALARAKREKAELSRQADEMTPKQQKRGARGAMLAAIMAAQGI